MKQILLTQGQFALVDDANYDWLNQWKWHALRQCSGNFYASRYLGRKGGKRYRILMHRQILGLEPGDKRQGDHINHNPLDNRQVNIRVCTSQQNNLNRKSNQNVTSNHKGVSWDKKRGKWEVRTQLSEKTKFLGYFDSEIKAALAYNHWAIKYHGNFAYLNKIP